MLQIILKIWYFVVIFPILIIMEGHKKLKKFMAEHGFVPDWAWTWLVILIIILVLVILFQFGYY